MRIEHVEAIPFRLPMNTTVSFATGVISSAEHVLVRVRDSEGRVGLAEATPRPMIYGETVASVLAAYRDFLAPLSIGRYPWELSKMEAAATGLVRNETARASLELACWDLYARQLGTSCHRLLGAHVDTVRLSLLLAQSGAAALVDEARGYAACFGVSAFRIKVGLDLRKDIANCEALRVAFGDAALLSVDANHGYDASEARAFAHACRDLGLAWFEEPCPAEHLLDRARLVQEAGLPILADESVTNPGEVAREILAGRASAICLKVTRSGILNSNRIRSFCESLGVPLVMGTQGESGIGTHAVAAHAASSALTSRYPMESGMLFHMADDLLAEKLMPIDGRIRLTERPGWGAEIDPDKLAHYRVDA